MKYAGTSVTSDGVIVTMACHSVYAQWLEVTLGRIPGCDQVFPWVAWTLSDQGRAAGWLTSPPQGLCLRVTVTSTTLDAEAAGREMGPAVLGEPHNHNVLHGQVRSPVPPSVLGRTGHSKCRPKQNHMMTVTLGDCA